MELGYVIWRQAQMMAIGTNAIPIFKPKNGPNFHYFLCMNINVHSSLNIYLRKV
jgi:hypothetical protein